MGYFHSKCRSTARLDGKTAIVTGSNTGIGKFTVQDFYLRGARVIMACRNLEKAEEAAEDIKATCEDKPGLGAIRIVQLDLSSLESVRRCASDLLETEDAVHLLINNAGVMFCPEGTTEDGFETHFGTNHLGHFLFTLLLLPRIIKSRPARIVNVSSLAHTLHIGPLDFTDLNWKKRRYSFLQAYYQSKLANVLFTKELARRLEEANFESVTTYSLHPGVIATELGRHVDDTIFKGTYWMYKHIFSMFIKTVKQGAQTTIHCAIDEEAGKETGLYYTECKVKAPSAKAQKQEYARKLWDVSWQMVELDEHYNPFQSS